MDILLKRALPEDFQQIAFAHHTAWIEIYNNSLPKAFLDNLSLESSIDIFRNNYCADKVVALIDDRVVRFCGWVILRENSF